jgi:hypothetical protein
MLIVITALQIKDFKNGIGKPFYFSFFLTFKIIKPIIVDAIGGKRVNIIGA